MNEWGGKTERERTSRPNTQVSNFTTNDRTTTSTFPVKQPASATPFPNRLLLQYIVAVEWVGVGPQSRRRRRAEQLFPRGRASQLTAWLTRWRLIANTYITYNSNLSTLFQLPQPRHFRVRTFKSSRLHSSPTYDEPTRVGKVSYFQFHYFICS